ncbi:Hsp20/alpha crystallin family protein [soil metagenome]
MTTTRNCTPAVTRYQSVPFSALFGEANRISDEFSRLFEGRTSSGPAVNVWADENAFYLETDVPGYDPNALEITVTDGNELTIKGERTVTEAEGAAWLRKERSAGSFSRTLTLPSSVNADAVEARCEHGVLKLTLPKSEAAKPKRISVKN